MDKKLKNNFSIRVLKDIGLYAEWIKARKKAAHPIPITDGKLNVFILRSILWTDSDYPHLWSSLYNAPQSSYSAKYIIEENKIIELKKIVKTYLKRINK